MTARRAAYGLGVHWEPCSPVTEVGCGGPENETISQPLGCFFSFLSFFFSFFFRHAAACLVWIRAPALRLNVSACKCGNRPTRRGAAWISPLAFDLDSSGRQFTLLWWPPPPVLCACVCLCAHARALIDLSLGLIFRSGKSPCHVGYSGARFWKGSRR